LLAVMTVAGSDSSVVTAALAAAAAAVAIVRLLSFQGGFALTHSRAYH
jgi:ethanolamine utilization microcompartment shell protein EutS